MTLSTEALAKLAQPLDAHRVKHREGSGGRSLSYLEGHDVIRAANDVFGIGQWTYFVTELTCLGEEPVVSKFDKPGYRVAYRAVVTVGSNGSGFSDVGYGDAQEYTGSKLTPHELASKEAVTDGLKRALKNFGDQFGLCLYDKDAPEHQGRNASAPGTGATPQVSTAPGTGAGGVAAGSSPAKGSPAATPFTPPPAKPFLPPANAGSGEGGDWAWPFGKHKGVALRDTPLEYVMWYAESGSKDDVKQKCNIFLAVPGGGFVGDDDIPFGPTIDGLGN